MHKRRVSWRHACSTRTHASTTTAEVSVKMSKDMYHIGKRPMKETLKRGLKKRCKMWRERCGWMLRHVQRDMWMVKRDMWMDDKTLMCKCLIIHSYVITRVWAVSSHTFWRARLGREEGPNRCTKSVCKQSVQLQCLAPSSLAPSMQRECAIRMSKEIYKQSVCRERDLRTECL